MQQSSTTLGKRPSSRSLVVLPLGSIDSPLPLAGATSRTPTQQLADCLQLEQPSTDAVADALAALRDAGVRCLDLSGQTLSATAVARLAQVLHDRPYLLSHFTQFNFNDARFEILWPLLDVLKHRQGEAITALDIFGARVLVSDSLGRQSYEPLQEDDLQRIAAVVAQQRSAPNDAPARKADGTAATTLVQRLRQGDTAGAIECLRQMASHTLDLSGQMLDAQLIDALVPILREHPDLLRPLHTLDLSDALLTPDGLHALLELFKQHPGTGLQGLYLSGTRMLAPIGMGHPVDRALNKHEWREIASFVRQCPALIELVLDRQLCLSGQMETLALALGASAVQHLSLRECDLGLKDLADLDMLALRAREQFREHRRPGSGLGFIDLRGNEGLFKDTARLEAGQTAHGVMTQFAVQLRDNKSLHALHLPEQAIEAFCDHEESALALMLLLDPGIRPPQLQQLEPFSSAGDVLTERLKAPQQHATQCFQSGEAQALRERLLALVGLWMQVCLRQRQSERTVEGLIGGLRCMQAFGLSTLDLSGTVLKAEAAARLGQALERQPELMTSTLNGFDWHNTTLVGGLEPWFALFQRHVALDGKVAYLNLANTKSAAPADSGSLVVTGLSGTDLKGLAGFVRHNTNLYRLNLSHQEGLSGQWALMVRAIGAGSVQVLVLWDCDLRLEHAEPLIVYPRTVGKGLRVIDLSFNERLFEGHRPSAVIALVRTALWNNTELQELWLPKRAESLLDIDWAAAQLMQIIERSGCVNLMQLEPWSSSTSTRFARLRQLLANDSRVARAGLHVLQRLNQGDKQGVVGTLARMRGAWINTLSFSGQALSHKSLACLQRLLWEQPNALSRHGISAFDFSDAVVEYGLKSWIDVLEDHRKQGGFIAALDCSGTQMQGTDASETSGLQEDDLEAIANLVGSRFVVRDLQLNRQPGLSGRLEALGKSSVRHLSLRGCALGLKDLQDLRLHALLQRIDLRDNDGLFTPGAGLASSQSVGGALADFVENLIGNQTLQALYLPANAIEAFLKQEQSAFALMCLFEPAVRPPQLQTLEPFLSAHAELAERFIALQQQISQLFSQPDQSDQARERRKNLVASAGRCVGQCLQRQSAEGVMSVLRCMQALGIRAPLDLSYMTLSAEAADCLVKIRKQQPALMASAISGLDVHFTQIRGGLAPWLEVLHQHLAQGGHIELLNLDFTRIETTDGIGTFTKARLSADEIQGIAELVAKCPTLRELDLSYQPNVTAHWELMAQAIGAGNVTTVAFLSCDLRLTHAERLIACALPRRSGSGLKDINLGGNDAMFGGQAPAAVIALVKNALLNTDLQELRLPKEALQLLDNDQTAAELTQVIQQSGHAKLVTLEPFSASKSPRFAQLKQLLAANAQDSKH